MQNTFTKCIKNTTENKKLIKNNSKLHKNNNIKNLK